MAVSDVVNLRVARAAHVAMLAHALDGLPHEACGLLVGPAGGDDVVLVIDVQGARKVRARGLQTRAVFVMPPSFAVLEQRLRGRSKDSEAAIQRRLQVARDEVAAFTEYDFVVVNDELSGAVDRLRGIVVAERACLRRMQGVAETIVRTF